MPNKVIFGLFFCSSQDDTDGPASFWKSGRLYVQKKMLFFVRKRKASTGGTADRGDREEGKGKSGRLSSQNRTEADERKRKARVSRKKQLQRLKPAEDERKLQR